MTDKILMVLKYLNISPAQFADEIGVQRSSISHLLSGRNNPSLDFIKKILIKYPEINTEWIIMNKGTMIKKEITSQPDLFSQVNTNKIELKQNPDLFDNEFISKKEEIQSIENKEIITDYTSNKISEEKLFNNKAKEIEESNSIIIENNNKTIDNKELEIDKVIIFYKNSSCKVYRNEI